MATHTNAKQSHPDRVQIEQLVSDIYNNHHQRLLTIARRNSLNHDDAEDALQDSFILFLNHFKPDRQDHALPWLTLTLKRRCWAIADTRKRAQKHQQLPILDNSSPNRLEPPDQAPAAQQIAEMSDGIADIRAQLDNLKPAERRAISLFALGYSYREIATITGWTYTKVNRCITEGRITLRQQRQPSQ